ncbi:MAG: zinc ribbon domain-containing protein [Oscillospiraceae bacterium]|jgi:hypothetical protein|nr:zinc ribbon domain-containing protein [Oscillospiraceae bacterium]
MKCPNCGHWNRDAFPRCFRCGTPLSDERLYNDGADARWVRQLAASDVQPAAALDETRPFGSAYDPGEPPLASEMLELKRRRLKGEEQLNRMRRDAAREDMAANGGASTYEGDEDSPSSSWIVEEILPIPVEEPYYDAEPPVPTAPKKNRRALHIAGRVPGTWRRAQHVEPAHPDAATALLNPLREHGLFDEYDDAPDEDAEDGFLAMAPSYGATRLIDMDVPRIEPETHAIALTRTQGGSRPHARGAFAAAVWALRICIAAVLAVAAYFAVTVFLIPNVDRPTSTDVAYRVEAREVQGLPGHVIQIPGQEGEKIVIRELAHTYTVINSYATVSLPDYAFYERQGAVDELGETARITLNPSLEGSKAMPPIEFDVAVPLSQAALLLPKASWTQVSTAIGTIQLQVEPGSKVLIGDRDAPDAMQDVSDTMDDNGLLTATIPVQDKGANDISILVTAPHARTNELSLTFFRQKMEITLTLKEDTGVRSVKKTNDYELTGYTKPGATIMVETPHTDLSVSPDGVFKFTALLTEMGDNTIVMRASYPDLPDSVLEHTIYYMIPASEYSKKAWALSAKDYQELLTNIHMRIGQIYLCKGRVVRVYSESPQIVIMDTGSNGAEQLIMLENKSSDTWKLGESYRIYADVSGMYDDIPRMMGRYTYYD